MIKRLAIRSVAAVAVAALCLVACGRPGETENSAEALELRTYQVPEGFKNEVTAQLRYVIQGNAEDRIGRVAEGAGNSLIVVAPRSIHEGLEKLVRDLEGLGQVPSPSQVRLTYWLVVGRPAAAGAISGRSHVVTGAESMGPIETALAGIAEAQGPTEFRLLERLELVSSGQNWARAQGRLAAVGQRTAVNGDSVVAEVDIKLGRQSLATEFAIRTDQHLVLGQAGARDEALQAFDDRQTADVTLYYVVAAGV